MNVSRRIIVLIALILATAVAADAAQNAQSWRGNRRVTGKVTDDTGKVLEGVLVKAVMAGEEQGVEVKTNKKGEFEVKGIAPGSWHIEFHKDGYQPTGGPMEITETNKPNLTVKLAPASADPNVEIAAGVQQATALLEQKKIPEARAIFESLLQKYPDAVQLNAMMARTYDMEQRPDKAIEYMRLAAAGDPSNAEVQLLLASLLVEQKQLPEVKQILASLDDSKIMRPDSLLSVAIELLRQDETELAVASFGRAIQRFPTAGDAYYLRAVGYLQLEKVDEAKADLNKYLELAPAGTYSENAKKFLEQLK
jgi:Tfp pilus assembly protein PilF